MTLWWVDSNNPSACTVGIAGHSCGSGDLANPDVLASVLYADGEIVDANGRLGYDSSLAVGDTSGATSGPGLMFPDGAEVHVVLPTHGPASADPALLASQLGTFDGGCATSTLPDSHPQRGLPGAYTGCANIQFGVFPVG